MADIHTISGVIEKQQQMINWAKANNSRMGYFAVLYQKMTYAVQAGIVKGEFENGPRMHDLIVHFANFYLSAWDGFLQKRPISGAWQSVFTASDNKNLIVLQHLILGINTHINLDLAKAAVRTCPGDSIYALQNDFDKINGVISSLMQEVQTCLEKIWWPLKLLANISNGRHTAVLNFSINNARKASWANAIALSAVSGDMHNNHVALIEKTVVGIGDKIISPGGFASLLLKPVLWMEDQNVANLIGILQEKTGPAN